ncbi:tRNA (cytidine(56)-2'-O)-methyltransferase [Candidatus Nitrosocosmicus franklandus]|uniref:tRNA (cytidine(56)-2'-O)-methyltransferase n=1 Tax=Candidatus Nitrosocosmicus franklandianus TaxID=1798806 RepID=A0A484IEC4_9ARCH|nr:tRNA (cytidine(56)-2'-O)-methyltransferase [Candidatus Nitrosocosmicus franklandus]VFJ13324.1 tRNA (cytidine(56)-2'-O)-methyltransferase [Candidatus Nitrosocosmicus franklandus]
MLEEKSKSSISIPQKSSFKVSVLRIGHRLVRDDRTTTHAVLVSRALGCERIYMTDVDDEIKNTLKKVNKRWGGENEFQLEIIDNWKQIIRNWKASNGIVVHLTMYGCLINEEIAEIRALDRDILVVIGAEKVPKEVYFLADYNIAIGNQPHSEIASLAIFLDRIFEGRQFDRKLTNESMRIVPTEKGKNVIKIK